MTTENTTVSDLECTPDPLKKNILPPPLTQEECSTWGSLDATTGQVPVASLGISGPECPPDINVTMDRACDQIHGVMQKVRLSLFSSATDPTPWKEITLPELVGMIRETPAMVSTPFKRCKEALATGDEAAYRNAKKGLPAVTLSGSFLKRCNAGLKEHSALMVIDVDHLNQDQLRAAKEQLEADPHCALLYVSPSGAGLKGGIRLKDTPTDDSEHKKAFAAVKYYLQCNYGLELDPACKDVSRLSFLSCDPTCFYNPNARPLELDDWQCDEEAAVVRKTRLVIKKVPDGDRVDPTRVESLLFKIPKRPDREDWLRISAAVRNALGDDAQAIEILKRWSPEEEEGEYERLLNSSEFPKITFGTLVYYAREQEKKQYEEVIKKCGSPFIVNSKGVPSSLNPMLVPTVYADRNHVLHDALQRSFFEYEAATGLWKEITTDTMRKKLSDMTFELGMDLGQPNLALKERSDSKLVGALNNLRALTDARFTDRPSGFIHCLNGMLDVRSGELRPFAPVFKSRNQTPFNWDEKATCPQFINELLASALNEVDIATIQLYAGMSLLGRNLSQKILLLTGTPGGGKSQLCIAIEGLVGRPNCSQLRTELLAERFELARFVGKTLLTGKDVPGNFLMAKGANVIKALSGGDAQDTEIKGKTGYETIDGEFCIIITSNNRLRVKLDGDTDAWRRRLVIVKYERPKPEKKIPDFARKLLAEEGSGILKWAVDGARRILELDYDFPTTCVQDGRVNALLDESDAVRFFVSSQIERANGYDLTSSEITDAFFSYCDLNDWKPCSIGELLRDLPDAMMEIHLSAKSNSVEREGRQMKGYRGVKIVNPFGNGTVGTAHQNP